MLKCLRCEFENPKTNKFCQNCGVSLTHKTCCQCREDIPITANTCHLCGADNYTVLWAIILQPKPTPKYQSEFDNVPIRFVSSNSQSKIANLCELFTKSEEALSTGSDRKVEKSDRERCAFPGGVSLRDPQNATNPSLQLRADKDNIGDRYLLVVDEDSKPLLTEISSYFLQGKVIDRYPLRKSHLAALQDQQAEVFSELNLDSSYSSVSQDWNSIGLPIHALPYLILTEYTPVVPQIYDAWQQQDQGIVLLPDRSEWQLFTELWSQQELPKLQIIWFLDEMAKLWQPLERVGCTQSLLIDENLRVDEDQAFGLQQLYLNPEVSPTLKDLARTWQFCLTKSSSNNNLDGLDRLLNRIISGDITEIQQLRLELHNLGVDESRTKFFSADRQFNRMNTFSSEPKNDQLEPDLDPFETFEEDFFNEDDGEMTYTSEFEEHETAIIPMNLRSIADASCTDIGVQRDHNEDFFGVRTLIEKVENNSENDLSARGLYIVCDGMGGHAAGEVASAMAVSELQRYFQSHWRSQLPDRETIEQGILLTNEALYQTNLGNSRSGSGRMGTTLVMVLLQDTQCAIAHVGDSRIYRISRKQGLEQLTLDHEVGQREINRGVEPEIAYGRPDAYQLTQALGPRDNSCVRPEIQSLEITEDCLLLLCSDGLSDNEFVEQNWSQYLQPLISSSANLQDGLFKFINFANEHNGHDNITAVLIRIKLKPNF